MKNWSRNYTECVVCKKTDKHHKGKGVCSRCYEKKRNRTDAKSRASQEKYRVNNREKIKISNHKSNKKNKETLIGLMGNVCCKCGFSDSRALQIDHINGGGIKERKAYNTKDFVRIVIASLNKNENKYQLLCTNCNWIKRHENQEWGK